MFLVLMRDSLERAGLEGVRLPDLGRLRKIIFKGRTYYEVNEALPELYEQLRGFGLQRPIEDFSISAKRRLGLARGLVKSSVLRGHVLTEPTASMTDEAVLIIWGNALEDLNIDQ